jgi:hypothetical protein
MSKLYEDPFWLHTQYVTKKKSAKEIADFCNVTEMTVWNWLKKFDLLKKRGKGRVLGARTVKKPPARNYYGR